VGTDKVEKLDIGLGGERKMRAEASRMRRWYMIGKWKV
jgi:hypothetical protein